MDATDDDDDDVFSGPHSAAGSGSFLDETHQPKELKIHTGRTMKRTSAAELANDHLFTPPSSTGVPPPKPIGQDAINASFQARTLPETRVLVLYTGGTIGMMPKDGVYCPAADYLPQLLRGLPPTNDQNYVNAYYAGAPLLPYALPAVRGLSKRVIYWMVEYEPLLDSCDMTYDDWIRIATDIWKAYHNYDGFVVLHGTDTMAYTASALSFMMENLGKPVVITGSQIPVFEVRSDGMENFIGAVIAAGTLDVPEVCIYFNNRLLRGNRCTKLDNAALAAFDSPNMAPLAEMRINITVNFSSIWRSNSSGPFRVHDQLVRNIGLLRLFPSISIESVRAFLAEPIEGVILQSYGAGNMPVRRTDILDALRAAVERGCLIVNITQCLRGQVDAHYQTGKVLADIGVIAGADMTAEAAMTKLAYVLGKDDWDAETKRRALTLNLRGEMTVAGGEIKELEIIPQLARFMRVSSSQEVQLLRAALLPPLVCHAASHNNVELLEQLREAGADFGQVDYSQRTALQVAASLGHQAAIDYLLSKGANVHARDVDGSNALLAAVRARSPGCVQSLRRVGATLPAASADVGAEICAAAARGDLPALELWRQAGAELDERDYDGRTAMHAAAARGHAECVRWLLDEGANPELLDAAERTPRDEARHRAHAEILALFEENDRKLSNGGEEENGPL